MKNKRTKLTALLLSALMAVSTISSVTWAADLFSDGSVDAEVVVEEPVEIVDDLEEDVGVLAQSDPSATLPTSVTKVTFNVKNSSVVATYTVSGTVLDASVEMVNSTKISPTCFSPEIAIYTATFVLNGAQYTVYSNGLGLNGDDKDKIEVLDACHEWTGINNGINNTTYDITDYEEITVNYDPTTGKFLETTVKGEQSLGNLNPKYGYIVTPGSLSLSGIKGHGKTVDEKIEITPATCTSEGVNYIYKACEWCKKAVVIDGTNTYYIDIPTNDKDYDHWYDNYRINVQKETISKIQHDFDGVSAQIVYDSFTNDSSLSNKHQEYNKNTFKYEHHIYILGSSKNKSGQNDDDAILENGEKVIDNYTPYNSHLSNGEMVADDPESPEDAYYFTVLKCKKCNTYRYNSKEYLKDASGKFEAGIYYVQADGGNVKGFVGNDGNYYFFESRTKDSFVQKVVDNLTKIGQQSKVKDNIAVHSPYDNKLEINSKYIKTPLEPILENCGKYYRCYQRTYESDTREPVVVTIESNDNEGYEVLHTWGPAEIAPKGTPLGDGTVSATEDDKLLTSSGKFVTPAKAKDCITNAKYQEYYHCIICGKVKKGDLKETGYNGDHKWGKLSTTTDPADDKYYEIDKNTHKRFTYYHQNCTLCGLRKVELAKEYVEAHNFIETKNDELPSQEATCGKPGYYTVQLKCKCDLVDTGSEKKTEIPATDKHDFGDNEVVLEIVNDNNVHVGNNGNKNSKIGQNPYVVYAKVVRKCTICGELDSNGINNTPVGVNVGVDPDLIIDTELEGRKIEVTEAKKDSNGVPYPCSVGTAKITFSWSGKVDGETVKAEDKTVEVPYYPSELAYQGRRDHKPDDIRVVEKVEATADAPGHITREIYCSVCGDYLTTETTTIAQLGSAPAVKAVSANYNTINVSWDAVEGADSYRLYYKSADVGVNQWKLVRNVNGTSYPHSGLVTGAKYRYTVRAVVDGVMGEFDRTGSVAIPKLAAPANVAVTAVSGKNKVSWSKVDGANGYIIQRSTGSGWTRVGSVKKGAKVTWTDKKPVSGATYRVRAYRTVNDANFSKNNVYSAFSAAK